LDFIEEDRHGPVVGARHGGAKPQGFQQAARIDGDFDGVLPAGLRVGQFFEGFVVLLAGDEDFCVAHSLKDSSVVLSDEVAKKIGLSNKDYMIFI